MIVKTRDGKQYKVVTTYNNEFYHYKVLDKRGKLHLISRAEIVEIVKEAEK